VVWGSVGFGRHVFTYGNMNSSDFVGFGGLQRALGLWVAYGEMKSSNFVGFGRHAFTYGNMNS
jgi:hypothetical protein